MHSTDAFLPSTPVDRRTVLRSASALLLTPALLAAGTEPVQQDGKFGGRVTGFRMMGGREVPPALDRAKTFLGKRQEKDGTWAGEDRSKVVQLTAMGSLFFLAYRGGSDDEEAAETLEKSLDWLRTAQDPETGAVQGEEGERAAAPLLQHAIATEALAESAFFRIGGKLRDRRVALERALAYLSATRLEDGSWPSRPGSESPSLATTLAVGHAFATAANYNDDEGSLRTTAREVLDWLRSPAAATVSTSEDSPLVARPDDVRVTGPMLLRHLLGDVPDDDEREQLCGRLARAHPTTTEEGDLQQPWRVFYGTFAAFQVGGQDCWSPWNKALKAALLPHQRSSGRQKGAWIHGWEDDREGGRLFGTILTALTLTAYVRYGRAPR